MSDDLDKATDELTRMLGIVERLFQDLHLGVSAEVPLGDGVSLTFRRFNGVWGLFVLDGDKITPLGSMSRNWRVLAARNLDALKAEMHAEVKRQTEEVLAVTDLARDFLTRNGR